MAKVRPHTARVLIRDTSTTTYHFGVTATLCQELVSRPDSDPIAVTLPEAQASNADSVECAPSSSRSGRPPLYRRHPQPTSSIRHDEHL